MAPNLGNHLSQLQSLALKAECMLDLLTAIVDDTNQAELNLQLVEAARDLVSQLNAGLDSGTLVRVEG